MRTKFRWLYTFFATVSLLVLCYYHDNYAYLFGEDTTLFTALETHLQRTSSSVFIRDSVVFINTGYDLQLVDTEHGKEVITHRQHLSQLLQDIAKTDYKYVLVDIRFEQGDTTSDDAALFDVIKSMSPKIMIAKHWDYNQKRDFPLADSSLNSLAAYCDYTSSLFKTAFEKYQYVQNGGASAALRVYSDLTGKMVHPQFPGIFRDGHQLCLNSLFLYIPEDFSKSRMRWNGKNKYWNLWEDFYGPYSIAEERDAIFPDMFRNKIIVIGDYVNDCHDTYLGKQPGPYLHLLAYDSLRRGKHIISFWYILLLSVIYYALFYQIFNQVRLIYKIPFVRKSKSRLVHFLISLVGYTFILALASGFAYILFQRPVSIFLPTIIFSIVDTFYKYTHYEA